MFLRQRLAYSHRQQSGFRVLANEVLIVESRLPVDGSRAGAIGIQKVSSLAHEILDLHIQSLARCEWWKKERKRRLTIL